MIMFILSLEKNQMNKKWKKFVNEAKLRVFDFDDTIVKTDAKIGVTSPSGEQFMMTPKEFAVHQMDPENKYDFSEFNSILSEMTDYIIKEKGEEVISERHQKDYQS